MHDINARYRLIASAKCALSDRVIINIGSKKEPEYYVATITKIRSNTIHVRFDDGDSGKYKNTISDVGLIGKTDSIKKRTSEITKQSLNKWLVDEKPKSKSSRKVKQPASKDKKKERKIQRGLSIKQKTKQIDIEAIKYAHGDSISRLVKDSPELYKLSDGTVDKDFIAKVKDKAKDIAVERVPKLTDLVRLMKQAKKQDDYSIVDNYLKKKSRSKRQATRYDRIN